MVAKIIAWGRDRPEALARLRVALRGDHRRAARRHHDQVLPARPARPAGGGRPGPPTPAGWTAPAPATAPADARTRRRRARRRWPSTSSDAEEALERAAFLRLGPRRAAAGRARGRPRRRAGLPRPGLPADRRDRSGRDRYRVELDGRYVDVDVDRLSALESRLTRRRASRFPVVAVEATGSHLVEVDGVTHRVTRDAGGVVRAPAPAVVVAVRVDGRAGGRGRPDGRWSWRA